MPQATAIKPASQTKTCFSCPHFDDFHEPNGRGWCNQFNGYVRKKHEQTNDCINSSKSVISHELEDNLALFSDVNFEELQAFPTEVIELDRDGYPMEEAEPTGYFATDFVTNPDEPF